MKSLRCKRLLSQCLGEVSFYIEQERQASMHNVAREAFCYSA